MNDDESMSMSSEDRFSQYDLYTLTCRQLAQRNMNDKQSRAFQAAFDACFDPNTTRPGVIIMRERRNSGPYWVGWNFMTRRKDPFEWTVIWKDPNGITIGPYHYRDCGVAIIEDAYYDFQSYHDELTEPTYHANRWYDEWVVTNPRTIRSHNMVHPGEIFNYFEDLHQNSEIPIEGVYFRDAYLHDYIIDGVPESDEHREWRRRIRYFAIDRPPLDEQEEERLWDEVMEKHDPMAANPWYFD